MSFDYVCENCKYELSREIPYDTEAEEMCPDCGSILVLLETETPLTTLIHKAVASGHRGCKAKLANPTELINKITASVVSTLESKGLSLADAGVKLQMQRLQQDLDLARRKKNKSTSKLRVHSVMLGFAPKSILSKKELDKLARMVENHPDFNNAAKDTEASLRDHESFTLRGIKDCRP